MVDLMICLLVSPLHYSYICRFSRTYRHTFDKLQNTLSRRLSQIRGRTVFWK